MPRQIGLPLALVLLLTGGTQLVGQQVAGVLVHELTGAPISGAYIVLLDSDSSEVARTPTNLVGRYTIVASAPGSYRLRTERIGYRSIVSSFFELEEGQALERDLRVTAVFVTLAALKVEGEARDCRVVGDQGLEVLTVWDEARKALKAVAWSDRQENFIYETDHYERWYTLKMRLQHERRSSAATQHVLPFRSHSAQELEEYGYVFFQGGNIVYVAPDAEVFFSAPFLEHHCFRLDRTNRDGTPLIGLRFEPTGGRTKADVKGVFWLDAETAELRQLELGYVNVGTWQLERHAAAELEFQRLPNGQWFVSRWSIRMPWIRQLQGKRGPVWDLGQSVIGFKEEGGVVLKTSSPDGPTLYARGRATVTGVVFDSTVGAGLADASVYIVGTDYNTQTAANGSYQITDLPEGRYTIRFAHPRATLVGLADEEEVSLRSGRTTRTDLAIASASTLVEELCSELQGSRAMGLLVGRIRDASADSTVTHADVRIVWLEEGDDEDPFRSIAAQTGAEGIYRACVPRGAPISVEVTVTGMPLVSVPVLFGESVLEVVDVNVVRRET